MYPISHFADENAYRALADRTFFAGRNCWPCAAFPFRKAAACWALVASFTSPNWRASASCSACRTMISRSSRRPRQNASWADIMRTVRPISHAGWAVQEAVVLGHFRNEAIEHGALFVEVDEPVRLEQSTNAVKVLFDDSREIVG